jgi:hypothetical protein
MHRFALSLVILLAACSGATGPKGLDPTVLITNSASDTLFFTWRDGQGIAGSVNVAPGAQSCTRFTAQADSAYFEAHASGGGGPLGGPTSYTQGWFDPATRPAWTMNRNADTGYNIQVVDVSPTEPC